MGRLGHQLVALLRGHVLLPGLTPEQNPDAVVVLLAW